MLIRQVSHEAFFFFFFCKSYAMRKEGKPRSSRRSKRAHIIETIHHCHLGATGTVALHTGTYNFLRLVLSRTLTFHSPGLQRIVSAALLPSQPVRVFITSCRISAASIISHCKAIRVLITRGPPSGVIRQFVSATVHYKFKHVCASSAMRVSATFVRCIMSRSSGETRNDSSPTETLVNAPDRNR